MKRFSLRMTEAQHTQLKYHLFPGDCFEAVAVMWCGRGVSSNAHAFTVREVRCIPHELCQRASDRITWPTDVIDDLVAKSFGKEQAIVKVHSHPGNYRQFSRIDDASDRGLFASITSLLDDDLPHASVIMMPDGSCIGRVMADEGRVLAPLSSIMSVGDDLRIWREDGAAAVPEFARRHAQAFGVGTTELLRHLTVAIVGCSGTGSVVAELLARLGVGRLILIDPDVVEEKNLNRILNSGKEDAYLSRYKVHVLAAAIARMGLGQEVKCLTCNLMDKVAVRIVASADVVFGCMDGVEGRHLLNRIATFYNLPYFDVGVRLDADGDGGIERIAGAVHYLQPGLSSLLSRGLYTLDQVEAESLKRANSEMYRQRLDEGYVRGVDEDRPAVVSVNALMASLLINEFLSRVHPHRNLPNARYAQVAVNFSEMQFFPEGEGAPCELLRNHVGRGDTEPLLERPALS
jgi:hypothetical protein